MLKCNGLCGHTPQECVAEAIEFANMLPTAYDVNKVIEQLADKIDPNEDIETGENCNNWVVDMQNDLIDDCIKIVKGGGISEG